MSKKQVFELKTTHQKDEKITYINQLIEKYNTGYLSEKTEREDLKKIIDACDSYLEPFQGVKTTEYDDFFIKHPILEILNLQKQAVRYFYLPEAKNHAKAHWDMLRNFFVSQKTSDSKIHYPTKHMEFSFFPEFHYRGAILVKEWIFESNPKTGRFGLCSFKGIQEDSSKQTNEAGTINQPLYTPEKRFKVTIKGGLISFQGQPLTTTSKCRQSVLYAVDATGDLYISDPNRTVIYEDYHHSVLLAGHPALCAGTLRVTRGKIWTISNESGHYKPTTQHLLNFLLILERQGVDLSTVEIRDMTQQDTGSLQGKLFEGIKAFLDSVSSEEQKKYNTEKSQPIPRKALPSTALNQTLMSPPQTKQKHNSMYLSGNKIVIEFSEEKCCDALAKKLIGIKAPDLKKGGNIAEYTPPLDGKMVTQEKTCLSFCTYKNTKGEHVIPLPDQATRDLVMDSLKTPPPRVDSGIELKSITGSVVGKQERYNYLNGLVKTYNGVDSQARNIFFSPELAQGRVHFNEEGYFQDKSACLVM